MAELLEPRADGSGAAEEVLLGEVLALRTILLNLLFSVANGKSVTPEQMRERIERTDGDKARKAMERLTAADGLYWKDYLKSGAQSQASARSADRYTLLEGMTAKGQGLILKGDQIETVTDPDGQQAGRQGWRLTAEGARMGIARLQWVTGTFNDRALHRLLGQVVYADLEGWEFYRVPVWTTVGLLIVMLFVRCPGTGSGG